MTSVRPQLSPGVIDKIYETVSDPSQWQAAIDQVRVMFHGSAACFVRSGPGLASADVINANPDPTYQRRYIDEHAGRSDIYTDALDAAPVGMIYSDRALIGDEILRRSRFWNEWMAPQDMYGGLGSKLLASGPSFWFLDVQRGRNQPAFDAAEAEVLQLIARHIARAAQLGRRLQLAQALASGYAHVPFGVLLVDAQLSVVHLNGVAEEILMRRRSPLRVKSGTLAAADAKSTAALRQLVADACTVHDGVAPGPGGDLLLRAGEADEAGIDVVLSAGPTAGTEVSGFLRPRHAIIYLHQTSLALPGGFADHARKLFDLTPTEARLAAALAGGLTLKDAAIHQGIRFSTARFYLHGIFRKTRTNQQSQLVALLKSTLPLIRRG